MKVADTRGQISDAPSTSDLLSVLHVYPFCNRHVKGDTSTCAPPISGTLRISKPNVLLGLASAKLAAVGWTYLILGIKKGKVVEKKSSDLIR